MSQATFQDTTPQGQQQQQQQPGADTIAPMTSNEHITNKERTNDVVGQVIESKTDDSSSVTKKPDATLTIRGTPEYNAYPFDKECKKFYFMASVTASHFESKERSAIDLCCIIDESSSMSGERITMVKKTVGYVIRNLTENDRLGIVGYGDRSHIRLNLIKMDEEGKEKALSIVSNIKVSGMTALCDGLKCGLKMMNDRVKQGGEANQIASVMLFTDGQANVGETTPIAIKNEIEKQDESFVDNKNIGNVVQGASSWITNFVSSSWSKISGSNDEKSMESSENAADDIDTSRCTINTFGFGNSHNEKLLEALAEYGHGMYTFIENTDTIGETFAQCLGGLVSIVGKNLKLKIKALNDIKIIKCLSKGISGYKISILNGNSEYLINIPDIQSDENRDFIFEIELPQLEMINSEYSLFELSCDYVNIANKSEDSSNDSDNIKIVCNINRCASDGEIGERNEELDGQYNRLIAAEAMDVADKLAEQGNLESAKLVLKQAKDDIIKSNVYQNKNEKFLSYNENLITEMDDISNDLETKATYQQRGGKKLKMNKKAHGMQRANQSRAFTSQAMYSNQFQCDMMDEFD